MWRERMDKDWLIGMEFKGWLFWERMWRERMDIDWLIGMEFRGWLLGRDGGNFWLTRAKRKIVMAMIPTPISPSGEKQPSCWTVRSY
jgi:hypothetical protein